LKEGLIDHFRTEVRFIHKSGQILWGDLSASALRSAKKGLEAVTNIIMDITEQKKIEEERLVLMVFLNNLINLGNRL